MNYWPVTPPRTKRKVFISYYDADKTEAYEFVARWATREDVFIPKTIGLSGRENFIDSTDNEYVMGEIRRTYLGDSTVTIVLIGKCTHSRRYIDWEIKTSLRQGDVYTPNGLIGIMLPSAGTSAHLPERFQANWNSGGNCYARYYDSPTSAQQLSGWIEDAYAARTARNLMIQNAADMMRYNSKCKVCGVTH
jgi:hypothetical protein